MGKSWAIAVLLIMITSVSAFAVSYDLEEIIREVEDNNRDIQLARLELKIASAETSAAYSRIMPHLNAGLGYNRNFIENTSGIPSYNNDYLFYTEVNQTLFSFEVLRGIKAARYLLDLSNHKFESVRQEVIVQVKKDFFRTLLLKEVFEVARNSEASAKENYDNMKDRYESGAVSEFDLLQAEVNWRNAIPQTLEARRDYDLALNNLKVLIGIPIVETVTLRGSMDFYPDMPGPISLDKAISRRPDYSVLLWEKKLLEMNILVKKSNYYPTLSATFNYSHTAGSDEFRIDNGTDNLTLGLALSIPIFSGRYTSAQVKKAEVELEKVSTRIAQLNESIEVELHNIELRMQEANTRIEAALKSVATAQRAFEIAKTRVDNKLATQIELNEIRVALHQAQVGYYSSVHDYLITYFEWELAVGEVSIRGY
jgi:outer membrane protein TolC